MWHGSRPPVSSDRRAGGEAAVLFLLPLAEGVALGLLGGPGWVTVSYVALGTVLGAGRLGLALRRATLGRETRPDTGAQATPAEARRPAVRRAVGYVCVTRDGGSSELAAHSDAIMRWTAEHGLPVVSIVHDVERQAADTGARPALRGALDRIASGDADTLVTARLVHLAPTVALLPPLVRWLTASPRSLIAIDLRLDTATEAGRLAAVTLTAIGGWEHERLSARTRRGLAAARARGAGGGPAAVADRPELQERIQGMRDQGMTLQAIADALNEAGVPTLRGGAKWRPSSVQRAAGYRRPPARQTIDLP